MFKLLIKTWFLVIWLYDPGYLGLTFMLFILQLRKPLEKPKSENLIRDSNPGSLCMTHQRYLSATAAINLLYHGTNQRARVRSPVGSVFVVEAFSSTVRQMSGNFRPQPSSDIIGHLNHKKSFITDVHDLWYWRALNPHI